MREYLLYVCLTSAAILAYLVIPDKVALTTGCQVAVGYAATAAILRGAQRQLPEYRLPWRLFALGILANSTGILVINVFPVYLVTQDEPPSVADPLFLLLYPALALGLALLVRRRDGRRDWATLVDSTTLTTGLGLLAWVFVIRPAIGDAGLSVVGRATAAAYPIGDVVLLAMTTRLMRGARVRGIAFWCLAGSLLAFLVGDAGWVVVAKIGVDLDVLQVRLLSGVFLVAYSLFGAAALHPGARGIGMPAPPQPPRLSPLQLSLLTVASLIAPGLLAVQLATGQVTDGVAIVLFSATLFLLVIARMAQLLRQVERQAGEVRELARQDELTGLPNRRAWNDELPRALERSRGDGTPACVALIDLDHFKQFNDTYGHPAGDQLLKTSAAGWLGRLREADVLARYGGEEFILLLPGTAVEQATSVLSALSEAMPLGQTFSAGVAPWDGTESSDALIVRADAALYRAKAEGRNRIVVDDRHTAGASAG